MREETLHIGSDLKTFKGHFNVIGFIDKYTRQYGIYIPSLGISAYGSTRDKANEMLDVAIESFFEYLLDRSPQQIDDELIQQYGWRKNELTNKDFSKSPVDIHEELEELNLEEGEIEKFALVA